MPDMEREFDSMRLHMADTKEEKSYELGFIAGKTHARLECLAIIVVMAMVFCYAALKVFM